MEVIFGELGVLVTRHVDGWTGAQCVARGVRCRLNFETGGAAVKRSFEGMVVRAGKGEERDGCNHKALRRESFLYGQPLLSIVKAAVELHAPVNTLPGLWR